MDGWEEVHLTQKNEKKSPAVKKSVTSCSAPWSEDVYIWHLEELKEPGWSVLVCGVRRADTLSDIYKNQKGP